MTIRNIVKIDEKKCNGCGECVIACAEGAIKIINGKAKLVSETYCDGLGACLGHCPQDAITVEKRECADFDEEATKQYLDKEKKVTEEKTFICPSLVAKQFDPKSVSKGDTSSQLSHWPVQIKLISPGSPFLKDSDLLLTADCVAFAMGDFHSKFLKNHSVIIACPKLDDTGPDIEKLTQIIKQGNIKSLTVVHMEVPCCFGLTKMVQQAIEKSQKPFEFEDVTIGIDGQIKKRETL